ncbi:MAG TPA: hypothetical protein VMU50_15635 [Polyangia bacterium]|nr:hypothetical protein [Polyangia bacterium]
MPSPWDLGDRLVRDGVLTEETVRSAAARQLVYGGALDTALLEMGVIDEATMWGSLARASDLPLPPPALMERADRTAAAVFDAGALAAAGLAVPVARDGNRVQVLCADPVDGERLRRSAGARGIETELYIAPEVRVRVAAQMALGTPLPPRFVRLLARLVGAQAARRWVRAPASVAPPLPSAPIMVTVTIEAQPPPEGEKLPAPPPPPPRSRAPGTKRAARPKRSSALARQSESAASAPVDGIAPLEEVMALAPSIMETTDETSASGETAREPEAAMAAATRALGREPAAPRATGDRAGDRNVQNVLNIPSVLAAAESAPDEERAAALRLLRGSLDHPRVAALAAQLRDDVANAPSERAIPAARSLGELRDPLAVPVLINRLGEHDARLTAAVRAVLVDITKQDLGTGARRWRTWWTHHQSDERIDWLFAGLSHGAPEIRYSSSEDLRDLTGQYFGYHYDLPKREREEARVRWEAWWLENRAGRRTAPVPVVAPEL